MKSISGITKETFLKAEDAKNRDAMLFDMLANITEGLEKCKGLKAEVDGFKGQVSFLKKVFLFAVSIFSVLATWFNLK